MRDCPSHPRDGQREHLVALAVKQSDIGGAVVGKQSGTQPHCHSNGAAVICRLYVDSSRFCEG